MPKEITIAHNIGFCAGVQRAINLAQEGAAEYGELLMLGDIVHNETVISKLAQKGIQVVGDLADIPVGQHVLLRAHGTSRELLENIRKLNLQVIDATCPLVLEIHKLAREMEAERRRIVIIVDHKHDEVVAIASQVKNPVILANPKDARNFPRSGRIGVVVQSTQTIENVRATVAEIIGRVEDLRCVNTICRPTRLRQAEIRELARDNEVILIVGSRTSANTKRLAALAGGINPETFLIQSEAELQDEWFAGKTRVGIAAGASTPLETVEKVRKKVSSLP